MFIVLSPAKTLDEQSPLRFPAQTLPQFLATSETVIRHLKKLKIVDLMALQSISPELARVNFERNQSWRATAHQPGTRTAIELFKGDVYQGLNTSDWTATDVTFAKNHLAILSGLYGLLRVTDALLPYRLEMGTRMAIEKHRNLHELWKPLVTGALNNSNQPFIVNLASNEYFKAVDVKQLNKPVIQIDFKDYKSGGYKVVSFWAKQARGIFARWIIKNKIVEKTDLESFSENGYYFEKQVSTENNLVFHRNEMR